MRFTASYCNLLRTAGQNVPNQAGQPRLSAWETALDRDFGAFQDRLFRSLTHRSGLVFWALVRLAEGWGCPPTRIPPLIIRCFDFAPEEEEHI